MSDLIAQQIIQAMRERDPTLDFRPGTVVKDWIIDPLSKMLAPYLAQLDLIRNNQALADYATLDESLMDALASNLYVFRNPGVRPRTEIVCGFDRPQAVSLQAGDLVQTGDGAIQYALLNNYQSTAEALGRRRSTDGLYYTASIAVEAVEPGADQEVEPGALVDMPLAPPNLVRITNPLRSQWGAARETNEALYRRIEQALSTRHLLTAPGTQYAIRTRFPGLQEIVVIGTGHALMERDETYAVASAVDATLPSTTLRGKVQGDAANPNRALRLATTVAIPDRNAFVEEVSNDDYRALGSADDSDRAELTPAEVFADSFADRPAFAPAEATLTANSDGTAVLAVDNPLGFAPGDLCVIAQPGQSAQERTVRSVGSQSLTLTETVPTGFTATATVAKKLRSEAVGNGWLEATDGLALGSELDGRAGVVEGGQLVLGGSSYATGSQRTQTDVELTTALRTLFKDALDHGGYNPSDSTRPDDEVDRLGLRVETTTTADTAADDTTVEVANPSALAATGTAYLDGDAFEYTGKATQPQTTTTADTADMDTIAVGSTTGFSYAGSLMIIVDGYTYCVQYTNKTATEFKGCTGVPAAPTGQVVYQMEVETTTRADTTTSTTTLAVTSTGSFESSGTLILEVGRVTHLVRYTGKTATTFTGCTGVPATTAGQAVKQEVAVETTLASTTRPTDLILYVGSTDSFDPSGTLILEVNGVVHLVNYTSKTATEFRGCTGVPAAIRGQVVQQVAAQTKTTADTLVGTVAVVSTAGFSDSGTLVLGVDRGFAVLTYLVNYTGKTATTFTGCTGLPATTTGQAVQGTIRTETTAHTQTAAAAEVSAILAADTAAGDPTITVDSTARFFDHGVLILEVGGVTHLVSYTGKTATSFTGCTGVPAIRRSPGQDQAVKQDTTLAVTSTTNFDPSGTLILEVNGVVHLVNYTGKTATTFTGCTGLPEATAGQAVYQASKQAALTGCTGVPASSSGAAVRQGLLDAVKAVRLLSVSPVVQRQLPFQDGLRITGAWQVDDSTADGKFFYILGRRSATGPARAQGGFGVALRKSTAAPYNVFVVDGSDIANDDDAYLARATVAIVSGSSYKFELLLSATAADATALEFRLWDDDGNTERPTEPTIAYGAYHPSSSGTHFGFSGYDTDGQASWRVGKAGADGELKIESTAARYPHYLFRLDAAAFDDLFRVRVRGMAHGMPDPDDPDDDGDGLTIRVYNHTDRAWSVVGQHTEDTLQTIQSSTPLAVADYRDSHEHVWVMASGDRPWGLTDEATLTVADVSLYDDGIRGFHLGGKVDVYVRAPDPLRQAVINLPNVGALEELSQHTDWKGPLARIQAIYEVSSNGQAVGAPWEEGTDYALSSLDRHARFAQAERLVLHCPSNRQGTDLRILYQYVPFIHDVQAFLDADEHHIAGMDLRCRAFLPAFVSGTIHASGYEIDDETFNRALRTFLHTQGTRLELSDLVDECYRLGATRVNTEDLGLRVETHSLDGPVTTTNVGVVGGDTHADHIVVADNVRFIADALRVQQIVA